MHTDPDPKVRAQDIEHQKDIHARLLNIIELLHGLPVLEAEHLLGEAKRIMKMTNTVDTNTAQHRDLVQKYTCLFGDDSGAPVEN